MTKAMRLTLVISSLAGGGAERAVVLLAEGFLKKGHQVSVVTLFGEQADFYKLPSNVQRVALNIASNSPTLIHGLWNNVYRIWILRRAICSFQPDLVISFLNRPNILTLLALIKSEYPVIVSEQNNPHMSSSGSWWDKLRRITYPTSAKIVSTSKGVDNCFDWLPKTKRAVIYNPLAHVQGEASKTNLPKDADPEKKWVIAMGRLTYQKGFDILLSAFQKIARQHLDWQLIILGEGENRSDLEKLRETLGLTHQVFLPGLLSNPFPVLRQSKLFVLSSRFEGFGNVLIEAMACGLPVISTDCPSGPREIIREGVDGILVPNEDVSSLATAMDRLMSNEQDRKRLAAEAPSGAERFKLEKIIGMWEDLFDEVLNNKANNNRSLKRTAVAKSY
ncbi:glycosyltransferase family 4 protein [Scytonema hofmannii]|nr:glycosyltransferase family 4 protein [Scytonema hofmannii]